MGWYVMSGASTVGPVSADLVAEYLKSGKLDGGTFVRDESAGAWMPVAQSPFAGLVQAKKRKRSALSIIGNAAFWLFMALLAAIAFWFVLNMGLSVTVGPR